MTWKFIARDWTGKRKAYTGASLGRSVRLWTAAKCVYWHSSVSINLRSFPSGGAIGNQCSRLRS